MKSATLFKGVRFNVIAVEQRLDDGTLAHREAVVHPGAVVILPLLADGRVLLIRNDRFAINEQLWELPAGTLEPRESPLNTAMRELIEETGYEATYMRPLLEFYTSPGFCTEKMYAFIAEDLKLVGQKLEATERITVEPTAWPQIVEMMRSGAIHDAKTLAALLYYMQFNA